jgi:hypothetical protein
MQRRWFGTANWYSKVLGEYPPEDQDVVIPYSWADAAILRDHEPPAQDGSDCEVIVDVARSEGEGTDRIVMAVRRGWHIDIVDIIKPDGVTLRRTDQTADRALAVAEALGPYSRLKVDDNGVGGGVSDHILRTWAQQGGTTHSLIRFNAGDAADDSTFQNRGAEAWWHCRRKLELGLLSLLSPATIHYREDLLGELTTRKGGLKPVTGRNYVEPKGNWKARLNAGSPDLADTVVMACYDPPVGIPERRMELAYLDVPRVTIEAG